MKTPNPSKQKKRAAKAIARKGKSEKRHGGTASGKNGEMTVAKVRSHYFGGGDSSYMSIPRKTSESNRSDKTNRNRFTVKAKHKKRLKNKD